VGRLVSIDPGHDTGWASWDSARLVGCGLCHVKDYPELPFRAGLPIDDLIVEVPQDYSSNRQVDPNDLISLGYKVGAIVGVFTAYHHLMSRTFTCARVFPREWKGQLPKNICHDRHLPKLDAREKRVLQTALAEVPNGKRHDVKDAVCLGLWRIKR